MEQLAPGVYAAIRSDPPGLMVDANCLFIVNEHDVVVVDAPEASAALIEALRALTDKPVAYLVNTHWHDDHVIGNAAWRQAYPGVTIIGHAALRTYLPGTGLANRRQMIVEAPQFAAEMQAQLDKGMNLLNQPISDEERTSYASDIQLVRDYMQAVPGVATVLPDIDISDTLVLQRGARRIEVFQPGRGHTDADLAVWLPDERIVATGDLVVWPVPLVGGEQSHVAEWPAALDRLLALGAQTYVRGHGPVLRSAEHLQQMRGLFSSVNIQVAAALRDGEALPALRKSIDLSAVGNYFIANSPVRRMAFGMYITGPAIESSVADAKRSVTAPSP